MSQQRRCAPNQSQRGLLQAATEHRGSANLRAHARGEQRGTISGHGHRCWRLPSVDQTMHAVCSSSHDATCCAVRLRVWLGRCGLRLSLWSRCARCVRSPGVSGPSPRIVPGPAVSLWRCAACCVQRVFPSGEIALLAPRPEPACEPAQRARLRSVLRSADCATGPRSPLLRSSGAAHQDSAPRRAAAASIVRAQGEKAEIIGQRARQMCAHCCSSIVDSAPALAAESLRGPQRSPHSLRRRNAHSCRPVSALCSLCVRRSTHTP